MASDPANLPCGPNNPYARGRTEDARYIESMMEHRFLSDVLQYCWFRQNRRVEVMQPEVDGSGYDLVLESNRRVRHVQLKSRWQEGRVRFLKINSRLREHRKPCVVWTFWSVDPADCEVKLRYRYSEPANWPIASPGESSFLLKWGDFLPQSGNIGISELIGRLI